MLSKKEDEFQYMQEWNYFYKVGHPVRVKGGSTFVASCLTGSAAVRNDVAVVRVRGFEEPVPLRRVIPL
jgi:hypothetical protein